MRLRMDVEQGETPVCAVGDCCQSIAVMAGLARNGITPTLIWFDSHGDLNTWETTPSGFIGGMPLAMLTGRGDRRMMQAVGLAPMADEKVILTDARDLDPGERDLLKASRIRHVEDAADLPDVSLPKGPIYVHFDMDILDSRSAPAFMYPVPGGPTVEDMHTVLAYLKSTGQVVAWSATASWDSKRPGARETLAATRRVWDAISG